MSVIPKSLFLFFFLTLIAPSLTSRLPSLSRATITSDLIGLYTIHTETDIAARPNFCPSTLTTETFEFQVTRAPSSLPKPDFFNIQIDHRNTLVSGRRCESAGKIVATTSDHPFVRGNQTEVLNTWSAAGRRRPARWVSKQFIDLISEQSFAVGYDFVERSCRGVELRAGVGFLWFQPLTDVQLGVPGTPRLTLSARNKYLLLTFANDPWSGCVFVADVLGGDGDFPPGPVSDPSLEDEDIEPDTIDIGSRPKPPPTNTTEESVPEESSSPSTEPEEDSEEDPDDDEEEALDDTDSDEEEEEEEDGPPEGVNEIFTSDGGNDPVEQPACFPLSASVQLENGNNVQLADLQLGHKVRVSKSHYSDVYFFSHRQISQTVMHDFIKISTTNEQPLLISPDHYLYVNRVLAPARNVQVGDILYSADGTHLSVTTVEKVREHGLIAPHTLHGDIVVDGIRTSTYTAAVHPLLAHYVLLAPVRALYHFGYPELVNGILDSGSDRLRRMVPRGPDLINAFL